MTRDKKAKKLRIVEIAREIGLADWSDLTKERMINEIKSLLEEL